ncbi:hypothetical protein NX059_000407 [Plenodomus lindquistii]|nr:hypothetical protein NX059_000407 [Plenodomus lindquistii]
MHTIAASSLEAPPLYAISGTTYRMPERADQPCNSQPFTSEQQSIVRWAHIKGLPISFQMAATSSAASERSHSPPKRSLPDGQHQGRMKRSKYTSTACTECRRCKIKCVRLIADSDCQRCASLNKQCIIVSATAPAARSISAKGQIPPIDDPRYSQLEGDVINLRHEFTGEIVALSQQVRELKATVTALQQQKHQAVDIYQPTPCSQTASPTVGGQDEEPTQPQFVGPTRSAFSFTIAEASLARMGISTEQRSSTGHASSGSSRAPSPGPPTHQSYASAMKDGDALVDIPIEEIIRLIDVYHTQVLLCHPILDAQLLAAEAPYLLGMAQHSKEHSLERPKLTKKDIHILRLVVATSLIHETPGRSSIADNLVTTVEQGIDRVSRSAPADIKDLQLMSMLSIYFYHMDEELFAWRAIGRAARHALEMGLHRRQSLIENFPPEERAFAVQAFWVVYQLDRRWSFGTSLAFGLNEKDIDPDLPEPDDACPYLKCMVAYGRLCSKVWEALPPYGASSQFIPKELEEYLDYITRNWLDCIPEMFRLNHTRSVPVSPAHSPQMQEADFQRLPVLIRLRGNYLRLLIHRHHVLSSESIIAGREKAQLVVNLAMDSIQVLVHFNETSNIYRRQPSVFHYYLLSALAILLLAVCHAPNEYAETCRPSFVASVDLVKSFSHHSSASRKLWRSIRGLLPIVRSLSQRSAVTANSLQGWQTAGRLDHPSTEPTIRSDVPQQQVEQPLTSPRADPGGSLWLSNEQLNFGMGLDYMSETMDLSANLMNMYDVFGSGLATDQQTLHSDNLPTGNFQGDSMPAMWGFDDVSRHFQGLL